MLAPPIVRPIRVGTHCRSRRRPSRRRRRSPLQDTATRHRRHRAIPTPRRTGTGSPLRPSATAINALRHRPVASGTVTSTPAVTATSMNHAHTASADPRTRAASPRTVVDGTDRRSATGDARPDGLPGQRPPHQLRRIRPLRSNNVTGSNTCRHQAGAAPRSPRTHPDPATPLPPDEDGHGPTTERPVHATPTPDLARRSSGSTEAEHRPLRHHQCLQHYSAAPAESLPGRDGVPRTLSTSSH